MPNPAIRIGQNVVHIVNTSYPHVSNTKFKPMCIKAYNKALLSNDTKKQSLVKNLPIWYKKFSDKVKHARQCKNDTVKLFALNELKAVLFQLRDDRYGNCYEDAVFSELILKINGISNVATAMLKKGNNLVDHRVCIFNNDGSSVIGNKITNNKTIIIDPWLGVVDFANNYFAKNQDILAYYIKIPSTGNFSITDIRTTPVNKEEIEYFKLKYPQFLFKSHKN